MFSASVFSLLLDGYMPSIILASTGVLLLCWQRLSLKLDPQEPPILEPSIPFIGHIIGLITKQNYYFDELSAKSPMPIATLPMLNGKVYMITSPQLIQSALRHKDLSFEPFAIDFAQRMLGVSDETMIPVRQPDFMDRFLKVIHEGLSGEHLPKMNSVTLSNVAATINGFGDKFEEDSIYLWLRNTLTLATSNTLFGSQDPLNKDPGLVDALWDFEGGIIPLLIGVFPSITASKAYKGRAKLQAALIDYYSHGYDLLPEVSALAKLRASYFRKHYISTVDIGRFEIALLHASTTNAIPTSFWTYMYIVSDANLLASIRSEIESILTDMPSSSPNGKSEITINTTLLLTQCPLFYSTYQETLRICSAQLGARRVMSDVHLTSTSDSRSYLLKRGTDVQIPAGVPHFSSIWGSDATIFKPSRFMKDEASLTPEKAKEDREMKKSFFPFGGGKHLCPGRNFALAEILGTVAVLVVGFEVEEKGDKEIKVPKVGRPKLGGAVVKPDADGIKIGGKWVRREGWEDVIWKFECQ